MDAKVTDIYLIFDCFPHFLLHLRIMGFGWVEMAVWIDFKLMYGSILISSYFFHQTPDLIFGFTGVTFSFNKNTPTVYQDLKFFELDNNLNL